MQLERDFCLPWARLPPLGRRGRFFAALGMRIAFARIVVVGRVVLALVRRHQKRSQPRRVVGVVGEGVKARARGL